MIKDRKFLFRIIARLILDNKIGRARREIDRYNAGKRPELRLRLLASHEDRVKWARKILVEHHKKDDIDL